MSPLIEEIVHEDGSDDLVSETIDETTQTSGKDNNKDINDSLDAHKYDPVNVCGDREEN